MNTVSIIVYDFGWPWFCGERFIITWWTQPYFFTTSKVPKSWSCYLLVTHNNGKCPVMSFNSSGYAGPTAPHVIVGTWPNSVRPESKNNDVIRPASFALLITSSNSASLLTYTTTLVNCP